MEDEYDFFYEEIASLIERLEKSEPNDSDLWWEIWDKLHHQGDVWISSYVAVPKIFEIYKKREWLDANLPAIFAVIENCRQQEKNPALPNWLEKEYFRTLNETVKYCAKHVSKDWDRELLLYFLMLVCAIKQNQGLYELLDVVSGEGDEKYLLELYYKEP